MAHVDNPSPMDSAERWEDVAKHVLRNREKTVSQIAVELQARYGAMEEICDGDELYPSVTMWYFTAPKS